MLATYVSPTSFSVIGNYVSIFVIGRKLKCNCGGSGYKYGTISGSVYSSPNTTITLLTTSDAIDSNLVEVAFSVVKPGVQGNLASRLIDGNTQLILVEDSYTYERADNDPADGLKFYLKRAKGSLSVPTVVGSGNTVKDAHLQAYVGSSPAYRDVEVDTYTIQSITGNNVLLKRALQMNNGSTGLVDVFEQWGDGIAGFPNQSMIRAERSGALSFGNGSGLQVSYQVEVYDKQSEYNTGTYTFTAKRAGWYHLDAMLTFNPSSGTGVFELWALRDSTEITHQYFPKGTTPGNISVQVSCDVQLSIAQTLKIYARQTTGSSKNTTANKQENYFTAHKFA